MWIVVALDVNLVKQHLSPKELGRAVGVSESSLKRWADEGVLRAVRTAGGHRRIAVDEAVRFIRQTGLTVIDPSALGMPELAAAQNAGPDGHPGDALADALIAGDRLRARGLILHSYLAGQTVAAIADHQFAPAMWRIGDLWKHDRKGIYLEHRATSLALEAVNQLRAILPAAAEHAPLAMGAAPAGDPYVLPSLLAATVLASEGWRDTNLGADTPLDVLRLAAEAAHPRLVWLSVTTEQRGELVSQMVALAEDLARHDTRLVIGGQHCPRCFACQPAICIAGSMSELAAYARGLAGGK